MMAGQYEKAITIKQAIDSINLRHYLLPAIQRKFVWSSSQICLLFDSIMRDYPINSFMMWDIRSASIKNDYKFYEFLKEYCQRFNEENPCVALMNPLMILVKIIKLRWIHILSYDQMVSRKINNQTTRC
ncbi:DUF262 domain-containing protein, partial [Escherichia coli]